MCKKAGTISGLNNFPSYPTSCQCSWKVFPAPQILPYPPEGEGYSGKVVYDHIISQPRAWAWWIITISPALEVARMQLLLYTSDRRLGSQHQEHIGSWSSPSVVRLMMLLSTISPYREVPGRIMVLQFLQWGNMSELQDLFHGIQPAVAGGILFLYMLP